MTYDLLGVSRTRTFLRRHMAVGRHPGAGSDISEHMLFTLR